MTQPVRFRYRVSFEKDGALRWIGHLDLQRVFERTMARARLPLFYTTGFHPRPKLVFASTLPLGMRSRCEMVDIWLGENVSSELMLSKLQAAQAPGMAFTQVEHVWAKEKSISAQVRSAVYRCALLLVPNESVARQADMEARVSSLLARDSVPRTRRKKPYDLRPLIERLAVVVDGGAIAFEMQLASREGATGRPEEVLAELGYTPTDFQYVRTALLRAA